METSDLSLRRSTRTGRRRIIRPETSSEDSSEDEEQEEDEADGEDPEDDVNDSIDRPRRTRFVQCNTQVWFYQ